MCVRAYERAGPEIWRIINASNNNNNNKTKEIIIEFRNMTHLD